MKGIQKFKCVFPLRDGSETIYFVDRPFKSAYESCKEFYNSYKEKGITCEVYRKNTGKYLFKVNGKINLWLPMQF